MFDSQPPAPGAVDQPDGHADDPNPAPFAGHPRHVPCQMHDAEPDSCDEPAMFSYLWPGSESRSSVCSRHAEQVGAALEAIALPLESADFKLLDA